MAENHKHNAGERSSKGREKAAQRRKRRPNGNGTGAGLDTGISVGIGKRSIGNAGLPKKAGAELTGRIQGLLEAPMLMSELPGVSQELLKAIIVRTYHPVVLQQRQWNC